MRPGPSAVLATTLLVCAASGAEAMVRQPTEGTLATREGKPIIEVPLEHTDVQLTAHGHLVDAEVTQTFKNPYNKKIEAVYLFPLPTGAAVHDLEITVGTRVIRGQLQRRAEAQATYVRAKARGHVAALLTQERPNLFTQQVANIEPGAKIVVKLRYAQTLTPESGRYELAFPLVAGPRYQPRRTGADAAKQAAADEVVSPEVLPPASRSSHEVSIRVSIEAAARIGDVSSPSHGITGTTAHTRAFMQLATGDTLANKDFVLRWQLAAAEPSFAVLPHRSGDGAGSFVFVAEPPALPGQAEIAPRELVFVLDTSSSMRGQPLAKARELVRTAFGALREHDTFRLVRFADSAAAVGDGPRGIANTAKNRELALAWLDALEAGGGTEMVSGIDAALGLPADPTRLRLIVFVTDGYVGNEDEILARAGARLGAARLFAFGVGSAVNRYLLEELAQVGRGAVEVVRPDEDTRRAVDRFHARIATPVLTDVSIDWNGLGVAEVTPARVPDLFAGQPLVLAGRYAKAGRAVVTVRGKRGGREVAWQVPVVLPAAATRAAVPLVWARAKIAELSRRQLRATAEEDAGLVEQITTLALSHRLMTRYTAFVAVDTSRVTAGGAAEKVAVPVEVPEGLSYTNAHSNFGIGSGSGSGGGGSGTVVGSISSGSYSVSGYGGGGSQVQAKAKVTYPMVLKGGGSPAGDAPLADAARASSSPSPTLASLVMSSFKGKATACYKQALETTPSLAGKLVVRLTVGGDGRITAITLVKLPEQGAGLGACVKTSLAKLITQKSEGGPVVIEIPIVFKAPADGGGK